MSVGDTSRATFAKHPWSIGGGGATELKDQIEADHGRFGELTTAIGRVTHTGNDEVYFGSASDWRRRGVDSASCVPLVEGNVVRDWVAEWRTLVLFPYDKKLLAHLEPDSPAYRYLELYKPYLEARREPGGTHEEIGLTWFEWSRFQRERFQVSLGVCYADIATHNHFVLDRGGKVFNRTAPVIKLPVGASKEEHLGLLGLLNSSVACFWFQQVCHNKGGPGGGSSKDEKWHDFYAFNSTTVAEFPLAAERPVALARRLDDLAVRLACCLPSAQFPTATSTGTVPSRGELVRARAEVASVRKQMVAWQEELDWHVYGSYRVLPPEIDPMAVKHADPPEVDRGERAFEIVLARKAAAGRLETRWFEWLGIAPVTEIPSRWPADYREVVQRRIDLIERERNIGLIESMGCKRRWEWPAWDDLERTALRAWLLDRIEAPQHWPTQVNHPPQITTVNRLADTVRSDAAFMQVAELYAGHSGFDLTQVVAELVAGESVPLLPVLRYTDTGLRKRAQWEDTWALQRREDAGEKVGKIPVPPKYQSKDFLKADFWRLRGGLDVPKERWVSYPGCERGADTSLPIAWAGWNHLQQATALAAYYLEMKDNEGWEPARLQPLLAGLLELVPWLEQWHNEIDPAYGERMGTYYRGFVNEEARALGFTLEDLRAWRPAASTAKRGRKAKA